MSNEIKAEFVRDDLGNIQTKIHKDWFFTADSDKPAEVETLFAEVKVSKNSEDKILKVKVDKAQLNNSEYQESFLKDVIFNVRIGWLEA